VFLSMAFYLFRACTNSMDQPPRQAFIAGAVLAEERTAVMGLINVVRTLSQSVGPSLTGVLASHSRLWLAFVISGGVKLVYDALMLTFFLGYRPNNTEEAEMRDDSDEGVAERAEENRGESRS
jgi:sugar phosphate permease